MTQLLRDEIRSFLTTQCQPKGGGTFRDDEPIFSSGRVDSLGAIDLMLFLEKRFGLDTRDRDFDPIFLDSIDEIIQLLPNGHPSVPTARD